MDDPNQESGARQPGEAEGLAATPGQPEAAPAPPEPVTPAGAATPPPPSGDEPAFTPPVPGQVISGSQDQPAGPGPTQPVPQVVTSSGGGKRWLKLLLYLVILAVVALGAWYAYAKYIKKTPAASTSAASKDIPLLKIGFLQADYGSVYPNMSASDYGFSVNSQMFEGLVRYENKNKIVPDLASTWTNPDNNTWVFTITKGVKFHDGHTLAASDVKSSLDQAVAGTSDFDQTFATTIASVALVGNDKVKITTKSPDPTLLNKLTFLYIYDANLPKGDEPSMAGTGPYEVKPGTKPTDKSYQMVAFDQYHLGRPTTRALAFGSQDDNAGLIKTFNAGQFDIAGTIDPSTITRAKGATTLKMEEPDSLFIGFNTVSPSPVQNKLVREAIRYAVDAQAIAKANSEAITPMSQLIPPSIPGYDPAITPYQQDVAKAKQLLAQAGYPNGLTMKLSASGDSPNEAAEIASELKQIGITVNIDSHPSFDEFISYFTDGKAQAYIVDYSSDTLDGVDIFNTTLPSANYNNPKLTDLLNQANMTVNPATRLKLLQQASSIVDQDVAVVPLGSTSDLWIMNKKYVIQQDMPTGYLPVYFYKVHLKS